MRTVPLPTSTMHTLSALWMAAVNWLAFHVIAPVLAVLHLSHFVVDPPREIARYFLLTAAEVAIIACVFRPMESLWPAERWPDRRATAIDRSYTVLKLFGVLPLFTYLVLSPFTQWIGGAGAGDDAAGLVSVQGMLP